MSGKWTPGPWKYVGDDSFGAVIASTGFKVCDNESYYPVAVEPDDMRLIAAAPELVEALRELLSASERHIFATECQAERDAARAALAKAGAT